MTEHEQDAARETFDDDVMERQTNEDWLAFQRDMEADWRLWWP